MHIPTSFIPADLEENPEAILKNQLNNSRSKMQYSFPQSQRFNDSHNMYIKS